MTGRLAAITSHVTSLLGLLAAVILTSCGGGVGGGYVNEDRTNRGYNPGVGPFDSQGNYVERWANDRSKGRWWRKSIIIDPVETTPAVASRPTAVAAAPTPAPKPPGTASGPKPKPPVAAAPTTKPAPAVKATPTSKPPIRHTIVKGDTLWGLSRKYGTTVSAIQRANGLKDTNLRIGRTLLIPRY